MRLYDGFAITPPRASCRPEGMYSRSGRSKCWLVGDLVSSSCRNDGFAIISGGGIADEVVGFVETEAKGAALAFYTFEYNCAVLRDNHFFHQE